MSGAADESYFWSSNPFDAQAQKAAQNIHIELYFYLELVSLFLCARERK